MQEVERYDRRLRKEECDEETDRRNRNERPRGSKGSAYAKANRTELENRS